MSHDETNAPVIEGILRALCDNPRAVELTARSLPGRVNWFFRADVNDMPKIVGKDGAHIRALQLTVDLMGQAVGEEWRIDYDKNPPGERRGRQPNAVTPDHHATAPDLDSLQQALSVSGIVANITADGSPASEFTFTLHPTRHQDSDALLTMHEALYTHNQRECEPLNLLGALGTLFRSIGRRQGVKYRLVVPTS